MERSELDERRRENDRNILYKCVIKPSPKMLYILRVARESTNMMACPVIYT